MEGNKSDKLKTSSKTLGVFCFLNNIYYNMENSIQGKNSSNIMHKIHYYLYKDNDFMKQIYSQIFSDLPDIGIVEYIASKSVSNNVEYKFGGDLENIDGKDFKLDDKKCNVSDREKNNIRAEIRNNNSKGINHTRIIANIDDVKQIVNTNMYNDIINYIIGNISKLNPDLCLMDGKLTLLETYDSQEDVFTTVEGTYLWLKTKYLDTDIRILSNIVDNVNILGYVIKDKTITSPKIIKVIAIYI